MRVSRDLFLTAVLGASTVAGCSREIKVDPKLLVDPQGNTIVDEVPDTKDSVFLSSVDEVLTKARLGKIRKVEEVYHSGSKGTDAIYQITLVNKYQICLHRPKDDKENERLIQGLRELSPEPIYISMEETSESKSKLLDLLISIIQYLIISALVLTVIGAASKSLRKELISGIKGGGREGIKPEKSSIKFSDVKGYSNITNRLERIVEFLKRTKQNRVGAELPKGILFIGEPGTGKTYLATAIAGEADVPIYVVSGSDFIRYFVGSGTDKVDQLFDEAEKNAPAIIFIDEIDAIGARRGAATSDGGREYEITLNQILVRMDGFRSKEKKKGNKNVLVIAATNKSPDFLDPALLRPGRFDQIIEIPKPVTVKQRAEVLELYMGKKQEKGQMDKEISSLEVAQKTEGFSQAELAEVINRATLLTYLDNKRKVTWRYIDNAIDEIKLGMKDESIATDSDVRVTAVHEFGGHYCVGKVCGLEFDKVSIIPQGRTLGHASIKYGQIGELSRSKKQLLVYLLTLLGGLAAEKELLERDEFTDGANSDLTTARKTIRHMLSSGMFDGHLFNDYSDPNVELTEEDLELARKMLSKILDTSKKIVSTLPREQVYRMIGEIFDRGEIIGAEANELAEKCVDKKYWDSARKIFEDFMEDPLDRDGSISKVQSS